MERTDQHQSIQEGKLRHWHLILILGRCYYVSACLVGEHEEGIIAKPVFVILAGIHLPNLSCNSAFKLT
jgi:hypothetical protein